MILFDLNCSRGHRFEAWFKDGGLAERQLARKSIACPECGDCKVEKAVMAPRIGKSGIGKSESGGAIANVKATLPEAASRMAVLAPEIRSQLSELRRKIEANCDYVGQAFADEARKIHYGESQARGIYGEADDSQRRDLADEGIEVARVPWLPREDA
jgi:hypothetical protein